MGITTKCYLSRVDYNHIIELIDNEKFIIGRNLKTNITDSLISREHLSCILDLKNTQVKVQWLGTNMSGINGFGMRKNFIYNVTHKDRIELLFNKIIYEVIFDPPPLLNYLKEAKQITTDSILHINQSAENFNKPKIENCTIEKNDKSLKRPAEKCMYTIFEKKKCNEFDWKRYYDGKLHIMTHKESFGKSKIAAYDLDGTLIKTQSGLVFPKNCNDWKIAFTEVPQKLKKLYADGFKIVIFTNQKGIGTGKIIFKDFKNKIENIATKLCCPFQAFIATSDDIHRKPAPGMWNELLKHNDDILIDKSQSFYCGDAAGRPANWMPKAKKDHSLADRLYALNIGLVFFTPEEHFLNHKPVPYNKPSFNPKEITTASVTDPPDKRLILEEQEMLILVGCPASGKSFLCEKYFIPAGYQWINRDTLGSAANCIQKTIEAINSGKSVVIDNTNIDRESRKQYIDAVKMYNISIRCAVLSTNIENALHNNLFRQLTGSKHQIIPPLLLKTFKSKFIEPSLDEGFTDIFKINFIPCFEDNKLKSLYEMFLLEK